MIGVGDMVIFVFVVLVVVGKVLDEVCVLVNVVAGVVVGKLGMFIVFIIELVEVVYGSKDIDYGVISEDVLIEVVKKV